MNFLVDANLPPALCPWLVAKGHSATAARDVGLRDGEDDAIWAWALSHGAVIATKDEDFAERRSRETSGPQLLWVRIGNTTNDVLFARLSGVWSTIENDLAQGIAIIEVR